ncbi:hypothetical protein G6F42_025125 [Rhizopus arrhizus]|nr:hypothetical protein G6F42_025125 [Rhizopus arrhizus]
MLQPFLLSSSRRILSKYHPFVRYKSVMLAVPTTLVVEQTNVLENDPTKFVYKTTIGNCSFNEFILSYPSGAYTGMRTVNRDSIVEWKTHAARMTNSLSSIQFEGKTASQTQAANEALKSLRDSVGFEAKVIPLLRRGLSEYYEQVDATTHAEHPSEAKVSLMATYSFEANTATLPGCAFCSFAQHSTQQTCQGRD